MTNAPTQQVTFPADLVAALNKEAESMGLSLVAYIEYLRHKNSGRLDAKAQDATRFVFSTQQESLRKLAQ